jgi:hypothetical protein
MKGITYKLVSMPGKPQKFCLGNGKKTVESFFYNWAVF